MSGVLPVTKGAYMRSILKENDPSPRTPENGLLTAAQKLNRKDIEKHYAEQIKVRMGGRGKGRCTIGKPLNHHPFPQAVYN